MRLPSRDAGRNPYLPEIDGEAGSCALGSTPVLVYHSVLAPSPSTL